MKKNICTRVSRGGFHRSLAVSAIAVAVTLSGSQVQAQNLLTNGNLDDPGIHESDTITGWTLDEDPIDVNAATFATFANNTPGGVTGLWYRAFQGTTFSNPRPAVDAHLYQDVPGTPGTLYEMTGWARFETNWPGGLDLLPGDGDDTAPPRWPLDTPSPTQTIFALEFLDATSLVLPGSVAVDLHDDLGQMNDNLWHEHTLSAVAPAGTVTVRVRASMVDGVNADLNPQSAFVDDFSLIAVPEPSAALLALTGLVAAALRRRA